MPQTGPGGLPLGLGLSEGLGSALEGSETVLADQGRNLAVMAAGRRLTELIGDSLPLKQALEDATAPAQAA